MNSDKMGADDSHGNSTPDQVYTRFEPGLNHIKPGLNQI